MSKHTEPFDLPGLDEREELFEEITPEQLENRNVDTDNFIDEVSAQQLEEKYARAMEEEGTVDFAKIWGDLDNQTMSVILRTETLAQEGRTDRPNVLFIDDIDHVPRNKDGSFVHTPIVPNHLKCWWVSPWFVRTGANMRGFRPVRRTPETEKWVPHATQVGSGPYLRAMNYVLCAMDRNRWLRRKAAEAESVSLTQIRRDSEEYQSAMRNAHSRLGVSRKRASELDTGDGISITRVSSPDGPRDMMSAESLEEES